MLQGITLNRPCYWHFLTYVFTVPAREFSTGIQDGETHWGKDAPWANSVKWSAFLSGDQNADC